MVPGDTVPGFWVVIERGRTTVTDSFPHGLPDEADVSSVREDRLPRQREVTINGHTYFLRTEVRGSAVAQVAMDRSSAETTTRRLVLALALAGGAGVVMAIASGMLLAQRLTAQPAGKAARTRSSVSP